MVHFVAGYLNKSMNRNNRRSLELWCIKGNEESLPGVDSSVPLMFLFFTIWILFLLACSTCNAVLKLRQLCFQYVFPCPWFSGRSSPPYGPYTYVKSMLTVLWKIHPSQRFFFSPKNVPQSFFPQYLIFLFVLFYFCFIAWRDIWVFRSRKIKVCSSLGAKAKIHSLLINIFFVNRFIYVIWTALSYSL